MKRLAVCVLLSLAGISDVALGFGCRGGGRGGAASGVSLYVTPESPTSPTQADGGKSVTAETAETQTEDDRRFTAWCLDAGVETPGCELRTTARSVAGRGVFATRDLRRGDEVFSVPFDVALTAENAAAHFPEVARRLVECRPVKKRGRAGRLWDRLRGREPPRLEENDCWQAELTTYALAALDSDHPWSGWIKTFRRDDPYQSLVDSASWADEPDAILRAVDDFAKLAPDVPRFKVHAALGVRLERMDEYLEDYAGAVPTCPLMHATVTSRAVGLSDTVTALLPFHDMLNHSSEPNVAMWFEFDEGGDGRPRFRFCALGDVAEGEELFLKYGDVADDEQDGAWDEDMAAWMLVQWGIPSGPEDYPPFTRSVRDF